MILRRDEPFSQVVVPDHRVLDRGTLRGILKSAQLSPEEFASLL
jgi:hypothetical protein